MAFGYETSSWWAGGGCVQSASNPKKTSKGTAASRRQGDANETLTPLPVAPPRSSTTTDLLSWACNMLPPGRGSGKALVHRVATYVLRVSGPYVR
jgi:hypothetical protein